MVANAQQCRVHERRAVTVSARIGILTLGAANRASIAQAIERAGGAPEFVDSPNALRDVGAIVFPGVANFGYVVDQLDRRKLRAPLLLAIAAGTLYLGICAGFQILFDGSAEAPEARGLGAFAGTVQRVRGPKSPHMGWNTVLPRDAQQADVSGWAYFAHEYAPPATVSSTTATTTYGNPFASIAEEGRVTGVQFHPERSGAYGASFLAQFVDSARVVRAR
jgi:imidazole glycerol phosphate synthase glutamine amidotransferase subunit